MCLGPKIFVYQKWPDKIFPIVNFVFPCDGPFGLEGGGGPGGETQLKNRQMQTRGDALHSQT